MLQQLGEDVGAGDDNLRPPRSDARHAAALGALHPGELLRQSPHIPCIGLGPSHANGARLAAVFAFRAAWQDSASAAAVPDVAITVETRNGPNRRSPRRNSRAMNCFIRAISSRFGGSVERNSSVNRTAPKGRLTVSRMRRRSERVISQLPPPTSIRRQRPCVPGSFMTPR